MRILQAMWICIELLFFLTETECNSNLSFYETQYYNEAKMIKALSDLPNRAAVNCTRYIPEDLKQWMIVNNWITHPQQKVIVGEYFAPNEYSFACLNAEIPPIARKTSPFAFYLRPRIEYSVGFNQVVSLGFDGILTTKALHFQFSYYSY